MYKFSKYIKDKLKKQKVDVIDYDTIKAVLKTLRLNLYSDHIVYIFLGISDIKTYFSQRVRGDPTVN